MAHLRPGGYTWQQQAPQPMRPGLVKAEPSYDVAGYGAARSSKPLGMIRPGARAGNAAAPTAADQAEQAYVADDAVVYAFHGSNEAKKNPMIGTLVGEYRQEGVNHGRNYYRKANGQVGGHEVYLYYWDERDGAALNGWWFGNMVGGREVWGRNQESAPSPPPGGWNIPWDSQEEADFLVMGGEGKRAHDQRMAAEEAARQAHVQQVSGARQAQLAQFTNRIAPTRDRVNAAEEAVITAIGAARDAIGNQCPSDSLQPFLDDLAKQRGDLTNVQRLVMQEGNFINKMAPELKGDMVSLAAQIRKMGQNIQEASVELERYRVVKVKEEKEAVAKEVEEERMKQAAAEFAVKLAELTEATLSAITDAEDEVEKVSIAAAPLETDTGDELEAVLLDAVSETEQRYKVAMLAIVEAKKTLNSGKAQTTRLPPKFKQDAAEEFGKLVEKLSDLQSKLDVYKTVRKDYQQRSQDMAYINDLSSKIVGAEVSLEQAAAGSMDTVDGVREVEKAAAAAQSLIAQTVKSMNAKWPSTLKEDDYMSKTSPALRLARELQERIAPVQEQADKMMQGAKDTRLKMITASLLSDVSAKMQAADEALEELAGPGEALMENFPEDPAEQKEVYAKADAIVAKAHSALGDAQAFLARKLAEATRLTPGSASDVKEEIAKLQTRLKGGRDQLDTYKNNMLEQRRSFLFQEVEVISDAAGEQVQALRDAAAAFKECAFDDQSEASTEKLKELADTVATAEKEARIGIASALRVLSQKTGELKKMASKSSAGGAELGKQHTRLSAMQEEITKLHSSVKETRERSQAKEQLTELAAHVKGAEAEVQKISQTAAALMESDDVPMEEGDGDGEPNKALQEFDSGSASAQQKLNTTAKLVDLKLRNASGFLKEELEAMRAKLTDAEEQLIGLSSKVQEVRERKQVAELLESVTQIVSNAESKVQEATDAAQPLEQGIENVTPEQLRCSLMACEAKSPEAGQALADAQAAVAGTLLEAQNLSEGSAKKCRQELSQLQVRMDKITPTIAEFRSKLAARKKAGRGQLLVAVVAAAEACTQKLATTVGKIENEQTDPAERPLLMEEMPDADKAAQKSMAEARQFIASQLAEVRSLMGEERKQLTIDLSAKQTKLTQVQAELTKSSRLAGQIEQRHTADQLLKDATTGLEKLQSDMEAASKVASPLLNADRSDLLQEVRLQSLLQALQDQMKTMGSLQLLFNKIAVSDKSSASLADFTAFLDTLPELTGNEELLFSEEQAKSMFLAIGEGSTISLDQLKACLSQHYMCSESGPLVAGVEDSKEVGTLERGEVLREVRQEQREGTTFIECVLGRDASTAWMVLEKSEPGAENGAAAKGNAPILAPRSSDAWQLESIEAFVTGLHERCAKGAENIDQRMDKVMNAKEGPLATVKAKLLNLRMKVSAEQSKIEQLRKRCSTAKAVVLQQRQDEVKVLQEGRKKREAMKSVEEASKVLEAAEEKVPTVQDAIKSRSAEALQKELNSSELDDLKQKADAALQAFTDAKAMVARAMKAQEDRNMLLEVRLELTKLNSRVTTSERRCKSLVEPVIVAHQKVVGAALKEAQSKLRLAVRRSKKTSDALYDQFSKGAATMAEGQFNTLIKKLPEHKLSSREMSLLFRDFLAEGLSRLDLACLVQEFLVCDLPTTMTKAFDVRETATVRKVEPGELFQIVDGPKLDTSSEVQRAQVKALGDGALGWVSVTSNKGKTFMRSVQKPVLVSQEEIYLYQEFEDGSEATGGLQVEELVELLEGPRDETLVGEIHVQGTCITDGAAGWLTLRDSTGTEYASATVGSYKCKAVTALTDGPDVKKCKVVRRVEVGEVLEVCGEQMEPAAEGALRLQFKMARDGKEGWVTVRGSRGTAFLEAQSEYSIKKEVALRKSLSADSEVVRYVEAGESFKASGTPKEDKPGRRVGVRVRSVMSAPGVPRSEGWVVHLGGGAPPLQPQGEPLLGW